jgi:photosystem II stability/assembly factor-like uncharacterized protein
MSGRISAVDAYKDDPRLIYVGAASGGVWKSTNGGTTFKPVFDKYNQSTGTITIDQEHPDTVWVGTGEVWVRNSVSVGDGIYKTTDGGSNWKLMGLQNSERIAKIIIDPSNHNVIYVAVPGHLWNDSEDRGVYKTTDGGKTWNKILYVNESTGCSGLAIDPRQPETLYAGMWQFRRKGYTFDSGGPGSGLYKTTDAGLHWTKLNKDLPQDTLGRIDVAFSPVDPSILYALIEAKNSGLYKSTNGGESWEEVNSTQTVAERPFYFSLIVLDPVDTNRIYKPGFSLNVSTDGGKIFTYPFVEGGNVHSDLHAMWINPHDNSQIYLGTDGGLYESLDRGSTWRLFDNLPVSQFYHVSTDNCEPYNVYGGLQDNGSWMGPSAGSGGITNSDWKNIGFGDGFNAFPDRTDDNIIFWSWQGGNVVRFYKNTGETKEIKPFSDDANKKLRFNWNTPIVFSPTQDKVMYIGSQFLYKSTDRGDSWTKISPDLTTNDPEKQKQEESGGLTIDNSTAENFCTIFTISESPIDPKIIWAGTDDGNLQVTADGGKTWSNIVSNIKELPSGTWCSSVYTGNQNKSTAYATFDGHYDGDMKSYVFKTTDLGKTWISLATDQLKGYAHVIREDLVKPSLLFLGTEFGLFVSIDGGGSWSQFTNKTPNVSVRDLVIQKANADLVVATHGRGIFIIEDITPLREIAPSMLDSDFVFLPARISMIKNPMQTQEFAGDDQFVGRNPSEAAVITYYLNKRHIFGDMYIKIYNNKGEKVKTLPAGKNKGINIVYWNIRKDPPKVPRSPALLGQAIFGPTYPPGDYSVKVIKGDKTYSGKISLMFDPKIPHSVAEREMQYETLMKAYNALEDLAFLDKQVIDIKDKSDNMLGIVKKDSEVYDKLSNMANDMYNLHKELVATNPSQLSGEERLRERLGDIYSAVLGYQGKPTKSQVDRLEVLVGDLKGKRKNIDNVLNKTIPEINNQLAVLKLEPIKIITKEEFDKTSSN